MYIQEIADIVFQEQSPNQLYKASGRMSVMIQKANLLSEGSTKTM